MAKRNKIDTKELLKMVKDGVEQTKIMEQFSFKSSTQLKIAYANALMESGEAPQIKGSGKRAEKKPLNIKIKVNKRGSLTISKKMIENMKIEIGTTFEAKKTASGIQLKKVVVKDESKVE